MIDEFVTCNSVNVPSAERNNGKFENSPLCVDRCPFDRIEREEEGPLLYSTTLLILQKTDFRQKRLPMKKSLFTLHTVRVAYAQEKLLLRHTKYSSN